MAEPSFNRLHLGSAYYPEHWPEDRWPEDIRLMREAGFNVARMGEFAWSTFEPAEGEFHFDWLDRAIDLLHEAGIASVLCTPTAAPPAWLTQKYPETLAVDEYGRRAQHGNRTHFCVNSTDYNLAVQRIVSALGMHYGPNPHVIGWQFDNEYNRVCYCSACQARFQKYLSDRFKGDLEALNAHWSTRYWSQTYTSWDQIPIPIGSHNPGLMLEWKRFITYSYAHYQKVQVNSLKPYLKPDVWMTHNFMGWFDGFDHYKLSEDLDMATWDYYVGADKYNPSGHHDFIVHGAIHDLTRGFKRRNFWVMETQPGTVNWSTVNNTLHKGEARVMAWQAVGHGADGILYWQWRSALGGQEQYHGTLVDQSGRPRPFYEDAQQLGREFAAVGELFQNSKPAAKIALLYDYESRWSIQWQRHHADFDYVKHLLAYYRPFARRNVPFDIISPDQPLQGYRLVIVPALIMLNEQRVKYLTEYATNGGRLLLTARVGMKDEYNALLPSRQPGPLAELAGVEVEEYFALKEAVSVKGNWFSGTSQQWAEKLKMGASVNNAMVARYGPENSWLEGSPAITVRAMTRGLVYYVGAYLDEATQDVFMERVAEICGATSVLATPQGVEACRRVTPEGKEIYLLINHERVPKVITIPWPAYEHITRQNGSGDFQLAAYGVAVLTKA